MLAENEIKEFNELHDRYKQLLASDNEDDIYDSKLTSKIYSYRRKSMIHLTCCQEIQDIPIIIWSIDDDDFGGYASTFSWHVCGGEFVYRDYLKKIRYDKTPPKMAAPKFCPFCATPLPIMERFNPGAPVCVIDNRTQNHCEVCHERLHCCFCLPPEAAWRPVECTCPDWWFPQDKREELRKLPHNYHGILQHHEQCVKRAYGNFR